MPRFRPGLDRQDYQNPDTGLQCLKQEAKIRRSGGIFMEAFARDYGQDLRHPRVVHLTDDVFYENPKLG